MSRTLFVTGTGTGVGKTVLGQLLVSHLLRHGCAARAFKPLCSGGRDDARVLWLAQRRALPLSVVNPWWFTGSVTPLVAARQKKSSVTLAQVSAHLHRHSRAQEVTLVEGAGGLLSPLGVDFSSRELISALTATPVIVAVNRLGVLNEVFLTWEALPADARSRAHCVLFEALVPDESSASNPAMLAERIGADRLHPMTRLTKAQLRQPDATLTKHLNQLLTAVGVSLPAAVRLTVTQRRAERV